MINKRAILVTGAHRSGTTWVGRALCASGEAAYIGEPLNRQHRLGVFGVDVENWYQYINSENESRYLDAFADTLRFRYGYLREIRSIQSPKDCARMFRDALAFSRGRLFRRRPLLKDPFAVFSVDWFVETFGLHAVVLVRSPLAFVASLKRLEWGFDIEHLLRQSSLIRDKLAVWRATLLDIPPSRDLVGVAAELWNAIYGVVWEYRDHPLVTIIRHEQLALDALSEFSKIYVKLNLTYNKAAQEFIVKSSAPENPVESSRNGIHTIMINSTESVESWREILTPSEINRVLDITEAVATRYYTPNYLR